MNVVMKAGLRKIIVCLLSLLVLSGCYVIVLAENGSYSFKDDINGMNEAAKSVFFVEIYDKDMKQLGTASGFVAFKEHLFVTNQHVIDGASYLRIIDDTDAENAYIINQVVASDRSTDTAILLFPDGKKYKALEIITKEDYQRGQPVVAIGSPQGFKNTLTKGDISAIREEDGITYIQISASISHGSSGGALFDNNGKVIGITSATYVDGQNLNFAISIKHAVALYLRWDKKSTEKLGTKFSWSMGGASRNTTAPKPIITATPTQKPTSKPITPTPSPSQIITPNPTSIASQGSNNTTTVLPTRDSIKFNMELSSSKFTKPETITVSITVSNASERDLPNFVTLYYPSGKQVEEFGSPTLTAGSSKRWSGSWTVTQKELDEGKITFIVRYFAYNDDGELKSYAAGITKHIQYSGTKSESDEKGNAVSAQEDLLQVEASVNRDIVYTIPAQVKFTVTVTNNSNVDMRNISVYAGITKLYTFDFIPAGESKTFIRDLQISQAGTFQFEAWINDEHGETLTFKSNTIPIKYAPN